VLYIAALVVTIVYWGLIAPTEDPFKDFFEGMSVLHPFQVTRA
jgi:hypothetical protein